MNERPPIYTLMCELVDWTLGRTADFPKNARFTFGQRVDNLTLDALMLVIRAVFSPPARKKECLQELNLVLEQLRVLWRIVQGRTWLGQTQLVHVNSRIDEIGRMAGGWLKSTQGKAQDVA